MNYFKCCYESRRFIHSADGDDESTRDARSKQTLAIPVLANLDHVEAIGDSQPPNSNWRWQDPNPTVQGLV